MLITELNLSNFRNFFSLHLKFSPLTTVIVGHNASGKTNILESIFVLAFGRSHRARKDSEMIRWGEEVGRVKGKVVSSAEVGLDGSCYRQDSAHSVSFRRSGNSFTSGKPSGDATRFDEVAGGTLPPRNSLASDNELEVVLTTGLVQDKKVPSKKYLVNDISRRWADFIGNLRVVLFSPEDIQLVGGEPSLRRNYLDVVLSGTERNYWRINRAYQKVVYQRNRLLEQINKQGVRSDQLDFWDEQLVNLGNIITQKRGNYVEFLNKQTRGEKNLRWIYDPSVISMEKIRVCRERDISAMITLSGPHRDDFHFVLNGRDLASFGSRGQQRTAILALKLGEIAYLTGDGERKPFASKDEAQGKPILLLDDIFSELDEDNRRRVLAIIGQQQTIMTTTDLHFLEGMERDKIEIWELKNGKVKKR